MKPYPLCRKPLTSGAGAQNVSMDFDAPEPEPVHRYKSTLRPIVPGSVPSRVKVLHQEPPAEGEKHHGFVTVSSPLTPAEMNRFDLYEAPDKPLQAGDTYLDRHDLVHYQGAGKFRRHSMGEWNAGPNLKDHAAAQSVMKNYIHDTPNNRTALLGTKRNICHK